MERVAFVHGGGADSSNKRENVENFRFVRVLENDLLTVFRLSD